MAGLTAASSQLKEGSILRKVTPEDLFNLPLYEHHLVIDTRSQEEYSQGHIATAVSYPSPDLDCSEEEKERSLVAFIKSYIKEYFRPENPSPIVVYGSEQPDCQLHAEWLATRLEMLQKDRRMIAKFDSQTKEDTYVEHPFNYFEHFCLTIADRAHEIWILEGGYNAFRSEYEFLCGKIEFNSMFPLPHRISKNLFLGTRWMTLTKDCLSKLQITHMIVSEYQKIDWNELEDISVLRCSVQDINSQNMFPCWTACTEFISEAISAKSGRILVVLFGRSRSTSVVIAYLIKALKMNFDNAWQYVCSKCWHLIDRSLVYEDQLRTWERMESTAISHGQEEALSMQ